MKQNTIGVLIVVGILGVTGLWLKSTNATKQKPTAEEMVNEKSIESEDTEKPVEEQKPQPEHNAIPSQNEPQAAAIASTPDAVKNNPQELKNNTARVAVLPPPSTSETKTDAITAKHLATLLEYHNIFDTLSKPLMEPVDIKKAKEKKINLAQTYDQTLEKMNDALTKPFPALKPSEFEQKVFEMACNMNMEAYFTDDLSDIGYIDTAIHALIVRYFLVKHDFDAVLSKDYYPPKPDLEFIGRTYIREAKNLAIAQQEYNFRTDAKLTDQEWTDVYIRVGKQRALDVCIATLRAMQALELNSNFGIVMDSVYGPYKKQSLAIQVMENFKNPNPMTRRQILGRAFKENMPTLFKGVEDGNFDATYLNSEYMGWTHLYGASIATCYRTRFMLMRTTMSGVRGLCILFMDMHRIACHEKMEESIEILRKLNNKKRR